MDTKSGSGLRTWPVAHVSLIRLHELGARTIPILHMRKTEVLEGLKAILKVTLLQLQESAESAWIQGFLGHHSGSHLR